MISRGRYFFESPFGKYYLLSYGENLRDIAALPAAKKGMYAYNKHPSPIIIIQELQLL